MSVFKVLIIIILLSALFYWYHEKSIHYVMDNERKAYFQMKLEYEAKADEKAREKYHKQAEEDKKELQAMICNLESQIDKIKAQKEEDFKRRLFLVETKYKIDMNRMQLALDYFTKGLSIEQVEDKFYKEGYIDGYRDATDGKEPEIDMDDI